jgi:ubiquinone/menaquinone biosynthesis C-methylase UbiE
MESEYNMPSKDIQHFNDWAKTYDHSFMQRLFFGPIHDKMVDLIDKEGTEKPPRNMLDVGCGTGRLLRAASIRWPQAQLFGVDPAEQMISEANRLNTNITFKLSPAESLPFPDQTFDLVVSSLSFHHWADGLKGLQEIARVLRPGGLFCLADHTLPFTNLFRESVKSREQIRGLINGVGLSVVIQRRAWMRFVVITLAKK